MARTPRREMNVRRARELVKVLREQFPRISFEVWPIAQGLAYINVDGPIEPGILREVLHTENEVALFITFMGMRDKPPGEPSSPDPVKEHWRSWHTRA